MTGTVESYGAAKGYGFIAVGEDKYWFHASEWMGRERPQPGDMVDFIPMNTPKGLRGYVVSRLRKEVKDGKN